ncbi:MAG: hypothetical protein J6V89_03725 [Acetobacter sp.]|nr:hypothetical protein [Acetobacter sp.]
MSDNENKEDLLNPDIVPDSSERPKVSEKVQKPKVSVQQRLSALVKKCKSLPALSRVFVRQPNIGQSTMSDNENLTPQQESGTTQSEASKPEETQPEARSQTADVSSPASPNNATETNPTETQSAQASTEQAETSSQQANTVTPQETNAPQSGTTETNQENSQEESQNEVATGSHEGTNEEKKEDGQQNQTADPQQADQKPEKSQTIPQNAAQNAQQTADQAANQGAPLSQGNVPQDSKLDPKDLPDRPFTAGTRRANRLPLILTGCGILGFASMIAYVAAQRAHQTLAGAKKEDHQISAQSIAEALVAKMPEAGTVKPKVPDLPKQKPVQTQTAIPVGMPPDPDHVPLPPGNNTANVNGNGNNDDYLQQKRQLIEQEKLAQLRLFYDSTKASPFVPVTFARGAGSSPTQAQAAENNTTQQQLAALQRKINGTNGKEQNTTENNKDKWESNAKVEAPKSPYLLRAGAVIPAILITGINSGLKGFVEAQVSENVYDTATGRFLLIPQGSRLLGTYNNSVVYGQKRLLVAWNRITFPDGKIVDLGSMPGTDFAGYTGFKDKVDNHFLRLFGSALLMSAITAGINLSQQGFMGMHGMYGGYGYGMYGMNSSSVLSQSLGQGMGEAMQRLFQRNLNIAPTLTVRPGYVLNVMVSKDLTFSKPYKSFDY